jgi:DedD protein
MEDALKKRLVGAVVLVSLAVIFVPMLIEDEPVVSPRIRDINIPPRPVLIHPGERQPPTPRSEVAPATAPPGTTKRPLALPLPEMVQQAPEAAEPDAQPVGSEPATAAPAPAAESTPAPEPDADALPKSAPQPEKPETSRAPPPEPVDLPAPAVKRGDASSRPSGWVVQVGSFANRVNADTTLARLREAGFDSFQEEIRVGDKVLYRVGAGPEIDRARAEQMQAKIAETLKLKGIVRRYP